MKSGEAVKSLLCRRVIGTFGQRQCNVIASPLHFNQAVCSQAWPFANKRKSSWAKCSDTLRVNPLHHLISSCLEPPMSLKSSGKAKMKSTRWPRAAALSSPLSRSHWFIELKSTLSECIASEPMERTRCRLQKRRVDAARSLERIPMLFVLIYVAFQWTWSILLPRRCRIAFCCCQQGYTQGG